MCGSSQEHYDTRGSHKTTKWLCAYPCVRMKGPWLLERIQSIRSSQAASAPQIKADLARQPCPPQLPCRRQSKVSVCLVVDNTEVLQICSTSARAARSLGSAASPVTQAGEKPLYLLYSSNHQAITWLPAEISGPAATTGYQVDVENRYEASSAHQRQAARLPHHSLQGPLLGFRAKHLRLRLICIACTYRNCMKPGLLVPWLTLGAPSASLGPLWLHLLSTVAECRCGS